MAGDDGVVIDELSDALCADDAGGLVAIAAVDAAAAAVVNDGAVVVEMLVDDCVIIGVVRTAIGAVATTCTVVDDAVDVADVVVTGHSLPRMYWMTPSAG